MKKITLLFCLVFAGLTTFAQTNLLVNSGFEDPISSYTVTDGSLNVLMRVAAIQDAVMQTSAPTVPANTSVTDGLWVKKAPSSGYIKAVVTTSDFKGGTSALNMQNRANNSTIGLTNWYQFIAQQRISGGLNNSKKYVAKFWAKVDNTANNVCDKVMVFVTDNTAKVNITKTITLTGGTTWTEYTTPEFDLPAHIAANPTANFSTAYFGIGNPTTYNGTVTNYSGVLLDEISLTEVSPATSVDKVSSNFKYFTTQNGVELKEIPVGSTVRVFSLSGMQLYSKSTVTSNVSISLVKGIYIVRVDEKAVKILVK